jgi:hypothetical protein
MDIAVVILVVVITLLGSFSGCLTEIPEPVGDFSEVPEMSNDDETQDPKGELNDTDIPISSARAERSSIEGFEVRVNSSFSASS